jgi:hypothetical protein
MAKRLSEREVASVRLLVLELSEDELTVLAAAGDQGGASRDEVEAILQDLHTFLKQPTRQSMMR